MSIAVVSTVNFVFASTAVQSLVRLSLVSASDDIVSGATPEIFAINCFDISCADFAIGGSALEDIVAVTTVSIGVFCSLRQVDGVVSVLSANVSAIPSTARVDDIVAITSRDFNVVAIGIVVSSVDDIIISPEVFIEGVLAVLVVTVDVDITGRGTGIVELLEPVVADDILATASVEVGAVNVSMTIVDLIVS